VTLLIDLGVLLGLIALLAFFSSSETSLFSLRPWRVERLVRDDPVRGAAIVKLIGNPLGLLVTLVVGAELVTIMGSNFTAVLRRQYLEDWAGWGIIVVLLGTSALFLLLGEISPKALAANYPEWLATRVARPLLLISRVLAPVARPLAWLASRLPSSGRGSEGQTLSEADFRMVVEAGLREGALNSREVEMIGAVFRIGDMPVRAVMVPRTDISALPATATLAEALNHIRRNRHSRVPIYEGDIDKIVGILYAKDLLGLPEDGQSTVKVRTLAREAFFVPEMMRGQKLIREFQARRMHLAVVVDEYGGTSGLVSLEDLLEEIVGEIADDYDRPVAMLRQVRSDLYWVQGALAFTEFKKQLRAKAKAGDYDTLGGYLLLLFGKVPRSGEAVSDKQFTYTVARMEKRRIIEVMIEPSGSGQEKARA
jgi:putative hemolysin